MPALGPGFDPRQIPLTGEQYLQHVLYERSKKCPEIVCSLAPPPPPSAAAKRNSSRKIEKVFASHASGVPMSQKKSTIEWQTIQINNFTTLRDKINQLRLKMGEVKEEHPTSDPPQLPLIDEPDAWKQYCCENLPLLRSVLAIPLKSLDVLLEYLQSWLQESEPPPTSSKAWITMWIYACLAYIFIPLDPNVCSVLRDIAKTCRQLRDLSSDATQNTSYSLIICIISSYFGQLDLSDIFNQ